MHEARWTMPCCSMGFLNRSIVPHIRTGYVLSYGNAPFASCIPPHLLGLASVLFISVCLVGPDWPHLDTS